MYAILAHARPLDRATGQRVDVYVSSAPGAAYSGLGGFEWEPAFAPGGRPSGTIELMSLDLAQGVQTASGSMTLALSQIRNVPAAELHWTDAPITIYRADGAAWPAPIEMEGFVRDPAIDLTADTLRLGVEVDTKQLETDLLTQSFDGDGAAGGDPEKFGVLKPFGAGACLNIEPVLYDSLRNIFMLDGYGNLLSVEWVGEGLSSLGAPVADYSSYANLAAAIDAGAVPPGRWATSIAAGSFGLGAPPEGVITAHATFKNGMTGQLISALLTKHARMAADRIAADTLAALDADVPFPIAYWTAEQVEVKDLVERLAVACNATPLITFQNQFAVARPFGGKALGMLRRQGFNEPAVTAWGAGDALVPYWRVRLRTARPIRVMSLSEVNYVDDLIPRGLYSPDATYREGHYVYLKNQSQWLYRNTVPSKGHAPPDGTDGDQWWKLLSPGPDASDLTYQDGTPIEDLQPDEAGAQISRNITLSESTRGFTLTKTGALAPGQMPYTFRATMTAANYDVTRSADWSITYGPTITATIDNTPGSPTKGQVTIQNVTGPGTINVHGISGGVANTEPFTITTKGALADASEVNTGDIAIGAVTNSATFTGPDVAIVPAETTLIETPAFTLGDAQDGRGIFLMTFNHDSSDRVDTGCAIRTYADLGDGAGFKEIIPMKPQGIRTENGNTYWAMNAAFAFTIASTKAIKVRITVAGRQIGGSGNMSGSYARTPRLDLFMGER